MKISRDWATSLTIGTFAVMGVTGLLMFFHADRGLNKEVHEWLGWAMVAAVVLHLVVNFGAFKRYFGMPVGRALIGASLVILLASFFIGGEEKEGGPPFAAPVRALARAPLSTLAQVAQVTPQELRARLSREGLNATSDEQTLEQIAGPDLRRQVHLLGELMRQP